MEFLEKTFRWFGPDFGVTLNDVRQTGATGVVTALHKVPTGEVWSSEAIQSVKTEIEAAGLKWSVVESVNIHEAIKTNSLECQKYIDKYIETLSNLSANDIKTVCYNFMPVLDWTRTDLNYQLADGRSALRYDHVAYVAFDLYVLKRAGAKQEHSEELQRKAKKYLDGLDESGLSNLQNTLMAGLPGTRDVISLEAFREHLSRYESIDAHQLRKNLVHFLSQVAPVAQELGVKLCIHPDDPPRPIFGLPRVVKNREDLSYLMNEVDVLSNGITFCTGSLGADQSNNLVKLFEEFGSRVHFLHLRSVQHQEDGSFYEANHLQGSAPMAALMTAIVKEQQRREQEGRSDVAIPVRPDHGHLLLDDVRRPQSFYPGYSTIGRMKGLSELSGLELGVRYGLGIQ
ncbi:mannonate dehydratase [Marinoscillum sp.]|uniref:mannonate dehydratase n=1 Tax=Marinoscillum sp. TaxID=2024838 RepID=UPI003BABBBFE